MRMQMRRSFDIDKPLQNDAVFVPAETKALQINVCIKIRTIRISDRRLLFDLARSY